MNDRMFFRYRPNQRMDTGIANGTTPSGCVTYRAERGMPQGMPRACTNSPTSPQTSHAVQSWSSSL